MQPPCHKRESSILPVLLIWTYLLSAVSPCGAPSAEDVHGSTTPVADEVEDRSDLLCLHFSIVPLEGIEAQDFSSPLNPSETPPKEQSRQGHALLFSCVLCLRSSQLLLPRILSPKYAFSAGAHITFPNCSTHEADKLQ